jgi:hypothetical protein
MSFENEFYSVLFSIKIAAGMNRDLTIMLLAIYKQEEELRLPQQVTTTTSRVRLLKHDLEITTETDVIKLPINAEIATAEEFRNMFKGNLEAGKEKNVRILSVRPGSIKEVLTKPFTKPTSNNKDDDLITKLSQELSSNQKSNANSDSYNS